MSTPDEDLQHENAGQDVIAVDADDTELEAGQPTRRPHRRRDSTPGVHLARLRREGNVLLASERRTNASGEPTGTAPSPPHPVGGQSQEEATRQRLEEELGISPDQYDDRLTDRFEYKRYFENAGVEHEVCAVLQVTLTDRTLDPDEGRRSPA